MEHHQIKALKSKADQKNATVTEVIISSLSAMQDSDHLKEKISMLENQISNMAAQYQKATGRKIRMDKKGVVQILVFQAYWISFYLHFIAFDFLYVVEFSRGRI